MSFEDKNRKENNVFWGVDGGFYSNYIQSWLNTFSPNDIRILFFDDIIGRLQYTLDSLCEWLEIQNETPQISSQLTIENKSVKFKFRNLQKMALKLNWKFEHFWRSHPRIKKNLRELYYAMNGNKSSEKISDVTYEYLRDLYRPYNIELSNILQQAGYADLPKWLDDPK
jgi:hypothetical protein